jgi:hypothetical protein
MLCLIDVVSCYITLSVEAFQDKLVEESVVPAAVNAVGEVRSNAIRCYKSRTNTYCIKCICSSITSGELAPYKSIADWIRMFLHLLQR